MSHVSVLGEELVENLVKPFLDVEALFVDCTFGFGGHSEMILEAHPTARLIAIDQDPQAVEAGRERFESEPRIEIHHARMSDLSTVMNGRRAHGIYADLGISSTQLDDPERGLSFLRDGPLDMRMDPTRGLPLSKQLHEWSREEIETILRDYGQERFAKRIANRLSEIPIDELPTTTKELSRVVVGAFPRSARHGRIHASTRSFQAFRIAVNEELQELDALLKHAILNLNSGGRLAVMSFHSIEDRLVKRAFKENWKKITKSPMVAGSEEKKNNPRSRSAKLRVAERL